MEQVVLATNRCDKATGKCALPVVAGSAALLRDDRVSWAGETIAVLGPFANCSDSISGGWSKTNCYLHSCVCDSRSRARSSLCSSVPPSLPPSLPPSPPPSIPPLYFVLFRYTGIHI